jgi:hypothetical protein
MTGLLGVMLCVVFEGGTGTDPPSEAPFTPVVSGLVLLSI